ncbi:MAG: HK97 family phage prohead protease [Kocuria rhizophila]|nr:HK97 family phage prohead protease [Kocuria rhizophila]
MTDIETRSRGIAVKSRNDEDGTFEAVVSAFGNIDSYGDVMVKGAFERTLAEWRENGGEIPFLWSHASNDPMSYVAGIHEAKETDEGLLVRGQFDLDTDQSRQAYKLLKSGRVREFSFGFIVRDAEDGEKNGEHVRYVKDVDLLEASMTILGANPATRLVAIKSTPTIPDPALTVDTIVSAVEDAVGRALAKHASTETHEDTAAASRAGSEDEGASGVKSDDSQYAAAAIGLSEYLTDDSTN